MKVKKIDDLKHKSCANGLINDLAAILPRLRLLLEGRNQSNRGNVGVEQSTANGLISERYSDNLRYKSLVYFAINDWKATCLNHIYY